MSEVSRRSARGSRQRDVPLSTVPIDFCPLPAGVLRDMNECGLRLRLRARDFAGNQRALGGGLLGMGLAITAFMVFWIQPWTWNFSGGTLDLFGIVFSLLGLPGLVVGLGMCLLGLGVLFGESRLEIGLTEGALIYREQLGKLFWTRNISRQGIRSMTVAERAGLGGIRVATGRNEITLGKGYPVDLLKGVAWELGRWLDGVELWWERGAHEGAAASEKAEGRAATGPVHYQAPSSVVEVARRRDGILFKAPARGIWKGSYGLFLMGGLFSLIALVLFSFVFFDQSGGGFGAVVMLGLFLAVGIGLAILGVHLGTRRAEIEVAVGTLRVSHGSVLFADKTHIWRRPEISSLRVEFSGLTVNNHRVNELRVYDGEGKKEIGCLAWLPEEDLQWIRSELTRALWGEGA